MTLPAFIFSQLNPVIRPSVVVFIPIRFDPFTQPAAPAKAQFEKREKKVFPILLKLTGEERGVSCVYGVHQYDYIRCILPFH